MHPYFARSAALLTAVGVIAGCGEDENTAPAAPAGPSIILENGNKLTGDDAAAYCKRFPPEDTESIKACSAVGVAPKVPEYNFDEEVEKDAEKDAQESQKMREVCEEVDPQEETPACEKFR